MADDGSTEKGRLPLTPSELSQARREVEARGQFLFRYAAEVLIGDPLEPGFAPISTGTAILVRISDGVVAITANHVLAQFETAHTANQRVALQLGQLRVSMQNRCLWRSDEDDLVMLSLSDDEASRIGTYVHEPPQWPPALPMVDDYVTIVGLPVMRRSRPDSGSVIFGPLIAHLPVLSSFANHFTCRIERSQIESLLKMPLPPPGSTDYGGMSGGPVFIDHPLHYPLAGFVKEIHPELEYFIIQGFANAPSRLT